MAQNKTRKTTQQSTLIATQNTTQHAAQNATPITKCITTQHYTQLSPGSVTEIRIKGHQTQANIVSLHSWCDVALKLSSFSQRPNKIHTKVTLLYNGGQTVFSDPL